MILSYDANLGRMEFSERTVCGSGSRHRMPPSIWPWAFSHWSSQRESGVRCNL